jgi:hypothetical protein
MVNVLLSDLVSPLSYLRDKEVWYLSYREVAASVHLLPMHNVQSR